jgi:hypothetical protein
MTKIFSSLIVWVTVCTTFSTQAFARYDRPQPALTIKLIGEEQLSERTLIDTKQHVQRIFSNAGIEIEWSPGRGLPLTVILLFRSAAKKLDPGCKMKTGFALSNDGRGARRAYVFADRVSELAWMRLRVATDNPRVSIEERTAMLHRKASEGLILGHVIAHEIGHLLLPHGAHTAAGIMSPQIDNGDFRKAVDGNLVFSPEQSELMRTAIGVVRVIS